MKRALRIRFAVLSACVIAFAQIAVAAQAWPLVAPAHHEAPLAADSAHPSSHCAGNVVDTDETPASPAAPTPNACEVHCQDAAQPDAAIAIAAPIADAWIVVPLVARSCVRSLAGGAPDVNVAPRPARVLFARFQI